MTEAANAVSVTLPNVSAETITFGAILIFAAVFLMLIDIYLKVSSARKEYREEKHRKEQPVDTLEEKVEDHDKKLKRDYERINDLEDGNRVMMRAMLAMLSHEISGNSIDKLKESMAELQNYLVNK